VIIQRLFFAGHFNTTGGKNHAADGWKEFLIRVKCFTYALLCVRRIIADDGNVNELQCFGKKSGIAGHK